MQEKRYINYRDPVLLSESHIYPLVWLQLHPIHSSWAHYPLFIWIPVWAQGTNKIPSWESHPASGFYGLLASVLSRVILQQTHGSPNHTFPYPNIVTKIHNPRQPCWWEKWTNYISFFLSMMKRPQCLPCSQAWLWKETCSLCWQKGNFKGVSQVIYSYRKASCCSSHVFYPRPIGPGFQVLLP